MEVNLSTYTDYLLSTPKYATATGMARAYGGACTHDAVTRLLSRDYFDNKTLWRAVKPTIRKLVPQGDDSGVIIVDDSILQKPHTRSSELNCYHFDHSLGRTVKGINFISLLYSYGAELALPVQVELIQKTEPRYDKKKEKYVFKSPVTKNELFRRMLTNTVPLVDFRYVLGDSWFASKDNINLITKRLGRHAILALKSDREVALSEQDKREGTFVRVDQLGQLAEKAPLRVYLRGVQAPVLVVRQVFTNKDGSRGVLFLLCTDLTLGYEQITTIYKKRWKVEVYHKSLKQHTALGGSPTKRVATQCNHFYAAVVAYVKLEKMRLKLGRNPFNLMSALSDVATIAALSQLQQWAAT